MPFDCVRTPRDSCAARAPGLDRRNSIMYEKREKSQWSKTVSEIPVPYACSRRRVSDRSDLGSRAYNGDSDRKFHCCGGLGVKGCNEKQLLDRLV